MDDLLTRRNLRHLLLRARNARVAEHRDPALPLSLRMNADTLTDLLVDGDPTERHTLDFEGKAFVGIPILTDPRLAYGEVAVDWSPVTEEPV